MDFIREVQRTKFQEQSKFWRQDLCIQKKGWWFYWVSLVHVWFSIGHYDGCKFTSFITHKWQVVELWHITGSEAVMATKSRPFRLWLQVLAPPGHIPLVLFKGRILCKESKSELSEMAGRSSFWKAHVLQYVWGLSITVYWGSRLVLFTLFYDIRMV